MLKLPGGALVQKAVYAIRLWYWFSLWCCPMANHWPPIVWPLHPSSQYSQYFLLLDDYQLFSPPHQQNQTLFQCDNVVWPFYESTILLLQLYKVTPQNLFAYFLWSGFVLVNNYVPHHFHWVRWWGPLSSTQF